MSPIQISSTGKISKVGGGAGDESVDSIEYPEADDDDHPNDGQQLKQAAPRGKATRYQKKTPMGKNKVRTLLQLTAGCRPARCQPFRPGAATQASFARAVARPSSRSNGVLQHKSQVGNRDAIDLDALATQANSLYLSTPVNRTQRPEPFRNDGPPPPNQPTTKAELEQRVSQVKGYLTRKHTRNDNQDDTVDSNTDLEPCTQRRTCLSAG